MQDAGHREPSAHDPDAPRPRTHGQVPRAGGFPALLSQAASLAVICLQLLKGPQKVLIQKEPRSLPTPLRETGETLQSGAPFSAAGLHLPQESAAAPASEQDSASSQPAGPGQLCSEGCLAPWGWGKQRRNRPNPPPAVVRLNFRLRAATPKARSPLAHGEGALGADAGRRALPK